MDVDTPTLPNTVTRIDPIRRQGRYWMLTIPGEQFDPEDYSPTPNGIEYIKGQQELGEGTSYVHWQILVTTTKKCTLRYIKSIFGDQAHCELSRSSAADDYVWKEETRIAGTQFEFGEKRVRRNSNADWQRVFLYAASGRLLDIEASVRVQHYRTLRAIAADFAKPLPMERTCVVYWGLSGVGKSRRAWEEAGVDAYSKDPRTKFWCSYQGEEHVIIDEFRGDIDISHLLRWLDRYKVIVEIKGASQPLMAKKYWITSNLHPRWWYKDLDSDTYEALERRLEIVELQ